MWHSSKPYRMASQPCILEVTHAHETWCRGEAHSIMPNKVDIPLKSDWQVLGCRGGPILLQGDLSMLIRSCSKAGTRQPATLCDMHLHSAGARGSRQDLTGQPCSPHAARAHESCIGNAPHVCAYYFMTVEARRGLHPLRLLLHVTLQPHSFALQPPHRTST